MSVRSRPRAMKMPTASTPTDLTRVLASKDSLGMGPLVLVGKLNFQFLEETFVIDFVTPRIL